MEREVVIMVFNVKRVFVATLCTLFFIAFSVVPVVTAEVNPFAKSDSEAYITLVGGEGKCGGESKCGEGKCGEGKCGGEKKKTEGKCGEGKCGEEKCGGEKKTEGKCGEGKCGEGKSGGEKKTEGKCGEK